MSERSASTLSIQHAILADSRKNKPRSLWGDALLRLRRNPGSMLGLTLLLMIIASALLAPFITFYNPVEIAPSERLLPPSATHWFGTDSFGRDIYTRVVYGGQISLRVGIISVAIAALLGVTGGMLAGYFGGWTDSTIMRAADVTLAFPGILLALVVIAILGPSLFNAMIAVGIAAAPTYARIARGMVMKVKAEAYVEAAICVGNPSHRVMLRHILPNILGSLVVVATLGVAGAIIAGAALSFLGLGAKPPTPEWGLILSEGRTYLRHAWWTTTFPGLAIMITVLSINLLGDGLRDALEPRMTR
jgi:peptide/nickel transport system permease protein